jgi:hypothetical protein
MPPAYHAEATTADTAVHRLDAVVYIKSPGPALKTLLVIRQGHKYRKPWIDFGRSILLSAWLPV